MPRTILPCLAVIAAIAAPLSAAPSASSVEELPIDKFVEYQAGSLPPLPWTRLKAAAPGIDFALRAEDESPFLGNKVTGKGLTMSVANGSGHGDGIEQRFTPAPAGAEFLAFDFRLGASDASRAGLDVRCGFVDSGGKGLSITMSAADGLTVASAAGNKRIANLSPGQWYHLGVKIDCGKLATLTLTPCPADLVAKPRPDISNVAPSITVRDIDLPKFGCIDTLRFYNCGSGRQMGCWTIGNILTAGDVSAPRNAWWPFDQAPLDQLRASDKKVFIYYFPIFTAGPTREDPGLSWYSRTIMNPTLVIPVKPNRVDAGTEFEYCPYPRPPIDAMVGSHEEHVKAMEDEVRLARQMGADGFLVDLQAFPGPGGAFYFNEMAFSLMEAAQRIDPWFKIIPAIYGPDEKDATDETAEKFANSDVTKKALAQPNLYHLADGRVVLTSWLPERYPVTWWKKVLDAIEKNGTKVAFVPQFNTMTHLEEFAPISYGMNNWGPRSPGKYAWVARVKPLGVKSVFPIVEQDVRSTGVWYMESCNSSLLRDVWRQTIVDNADWAFIDTWSDYTEQAQEPSRSIGYAPFDMDAYYTQWYKTGKQPAIKRDVLYYFYRNQHTDAVAAHGKPWVLRKPWGDNNETTPRNDIELVAFLKQPGQLRIEEAGKVYTRDAPAGITSFTAPIPLGAAFTPVFSLVRGDKSVVSRAGLYPVLDKVEFGNMMYHSGVISPAAKR